MYRKPQDLYICAILCSEIGQRLVEHPLRGKSRGSIVVDYILNSLSSGEQRGIKVIIIRLSPIVKFKLKRDI